MTSDRFDNRPDGCNRRRNSHLPPSKKSIAPQGAQKESTVSEKPAEGLSIQEKIGRGVAVTAVLGTLIVPRMVHKYFQEKPIPYLSNSSLFEMAGTLNTSSNDSARVEYYLGRDVEVSSILVNDPISPSMNKVRDDITLTYSFQMKNGSNSIPAYMTVTTSDESPLTLQLLEKASRKDGVYASMAGHLERDDKGEPRFKILRAIVHPSLERERQELADLILKRDELKKDVERLN